jgi:hypothetical protein
MEIISLVRHQAHRCVKSSDSRSMHHVCIGEFSPQAYVKRPGTIGGFSFHGASCQAGPIANPGSAKGKLDEEMALEVLHPTTHHNASVPLLEHRRLRLHAEVGHTDRRPLRLAA